MSGKGKTMRLTPTATALLVATITLLPSFSQAQDKPTPPGLGDPGILQSISIETGRLADGKFIVSGRDATQQLVVSGHYDSGQFRDLSRDVTYTITPDGIAAIDGTGHVTPIAEGTATIQARTKDGKDANLQLEVTNIVEDVQVNFAN
ncbi:MAG: hypothetical protein ACI9HK_004798, partial [Pirellulaceae bacterium]